nr:unnamed protein product [Spirometra erinaceieuropaei]
MIRLDVEVMPTCLLNDKSEMQRWEQLQGRTEEAADMGREREENFDRSCGKGVCGYFEAVHRLFLPTHGYAIPILDPRQKVFTSLKQPNPLRGERYSPTAWDGPEAKSSILSDARLCCMLISVMISHLGDFFR